MNPAELALSANINITTDNDNDSADTLPLSDPPALTVPAATIDAGLAAKASFLPNEIWFQVLEHLDLSALWAVHTTCRTFHQICLRLIAQSLKARKPHIPGRSVPDEAMAVAFGKFPMLPGNNQIVTALFLRLVRWCEKTWTFEFEPTGEAKFGIWIHRIGFLPMSHAYKMAKFWFPKTAPPRLHLWFCPEECYSSQFGGEAVGATASNVEQLPGLQQVLESELGKHLGSIDKDKGWVEYEVVVDVEMHVEGDPDAVTADDPPSQHQQQQQSDSGLASGSFHNVFGRLGRVHLRGETMFGR